MVNVSLYLPRLADKVVVNAPNGEMRTVHVEYFREDKDIGYWLARHEPNVGGIRRSEADVGHLGAFRFISPPESRNISRKFLTGEEKARYSRVENTEQALGTNLSRDDFYGDSYVYQKSGGQLILGGPDSPRDGDHNGMRVYRIGRMEASDKGFQDMRKAAFRGIRNAFEKFGYMVHGFGDNEPYDANTSQLLPEPKISRVSENEARRLRALGIDDSTMRQIEEL